MDTIRIIKLVNGETIIGNVEQQQEGLRVADPLSVDYRNKMLVVEFWVPYSEGDVDITLNYNHIIMQSPIDKSVEEHYYSCLEAMKSDDEEQELEDDDYEVVSNNAPVLH